MGSLGTLVSVELFPLISAISGSQVRFPGYRSARLWELPIWWELVAWLLLLFLSVLVACLARRHVVALPVGFFVVVWLVVRYFLVMPEEPWNSGAVYWISVGGFRMSGPLVILFLPETALALFWGILLATEVRESNRLPAKRMVELMVLRVPPMTILVLSVLVPLAAAFGYIVDFERAYLGYKEALFLPLGFSGGGNFWERYQAVPAFYTFGNVDQYAVYESIRAFAQFPFLVLVLSIIAGGFLRRPWQRIAWTSAVSLVWVGVLFVLAGRLDYEFAGTVPGAIQVLLLSPSCPVAFFWAAMLSGDSRILSHGKPVLRFLVNRVSLFIVLYFFLNIIFIFWLHPDYALRLKWLYRAGLAFDIPGV